MDIYLFFFLMMIEKGKSQYGNYYEIFFRGYIYINGNLFTTLLMQLL